MFDKMSGKEVFGDGNIASYYLLSDVDRMDALSFQKIALYLQNKYKSNKKLYLTVMERYFGGSFPSEYKREYDDQIRVSVSKEKYIKEKPEAVLPLEEPENYFQKLLYDIDKENLEYWDWDNASLMIYMSDMQRVYEMTFDIGDIRIKANVDYFYLNRDIIDLEDTVKQKIKVVE